MSMTPRAYWKKVVGDVLRSVSNQQMTALCEEFLKPGAVFIMKIEQAPLRTGKTEFKSVVEIKPAMPRDGNKEVAEELVKLTTAKPKRP
jgi:hypothetical protein